MSFINFFWVGVRSWVGGCCLLWLPCVSPWVGRQRRADGGAFAHHQTFRSQMAVDLAKDLTRQRFRFEQMAKFEQRRRVQGRFAVQVNADTKVRKD